MSDPPSRILWRGRHRKGPSRTGISDEGRRARAPAANESQIENKVKQLRPGPNGHKFRGSASGAPRKNRTWETRRLARSIRDVAFASRRESVAEARPRCGSGDRLIWTQPSLRQAQLVGQTIWRICSSKNRCGFEVITKCPDAVKSKAGSQHFFIFERSRSASLQSFRRLTVPRAT
jgi:hypothetical protein